MDIETEIRTFVITKPIQRKSEHGHLVTVSKPCNTECHVQFESKNGNITNPIGQLHSVDGDLELDSKHLNTKSPTQRQSAYKDIEAEDVKLYTSIMQSKSSICKGEKYDNSSSTSPLLKVIPLALLQHENGNITNPLVPLHYLHKDLKKDTKSLLKIQSSNRDIDAEDAEFLVQSECVLWNCEFDVKPHNTESTAQLQSGNGNITNPLVQLPISNGDIMTVTKPCDIESLPQVNSSDQDIETKDVKRYITESLVQSNTAFWNHEVDVKPYTIKQTQLKGILQNNLDITSDRNEPRYSLDVELKTDTTPYSIKPQLPIQNLDQDIEAENVEPFIMKSLEECVEARAVLVPISDPNLNCESEKVCNEIEMKTLSSENESMNFTSMCMPIENVLNEDGLERYPLVCDTLHTTKNVLNLQNLQQNVQNLQQNVNGVASRPDDTKYNQLQHILRKNYTSNYYRRTVVQNVSLSRHSSCHASKYNNSVGKLKKIVLTPISGRHLKKLSGQEKDSCVCCRKSFKRRGHLSRHLLIQQRKKYSCSECGKSYQLRNQLTMHLLIHSGETKYPCIECVKKFAGKNNLNIHLSNHSGEEKYSCDECGKKFTQKRTLNVNLLIHSGEKRYSCRKCGRRFTEKSNLNSHLLIHSGEKTYSCAECGKKFTLKSTLSQHLSIHSRDKKYSCAECKNTFTQERSIKNHLSIHSREEYNCGECGKKFTQKGNLNQHLLIHSGDKKYKCDECEKKFTQKRSLNNHLLVHSGEKKYSCDECGKRFTQKCSLNRHLLIHLGEKKYSCDECGKKFTQKSSLNSHLLIHLGEKKYSCDECAKKFTHKCNLNQHLLTHSGEKKYGCNECGKKFTQKSKLNRHLSIHLGEKKYICDECGKKFTQKCSLNEHLLIHLGEKKYICAECGKTFTRKSTLRYHLSIHSGENKYSCVECGKKFKLRGNLIKHLLIHSVEKK